ncbi:DUF1156 domain-containing protein [Nocardioides sp. ChNu-153]|uniref:DUF1156 domain-containing protein n=1 Tax=Nocardioides sp. ChNu-153 TaxID=2779364 RepID=UPI0026552980|nr:DUF1156 domain-containing protein [Nocardioides sp. ChNu-153]MDN7121457.1 DUF1156 domain-containing protein [Nocardioides sp. ChNu-153]
MSYKRKLIEVSLPLEAINRESAREKNIRHGHPSTLHLWWARRPLAAARAVLFAQLVDDPSSRPDEFPTEEDQKRERARLHAIIERLVRWDNARDEKLLDEANAEIMKSAEGKPPAIIDPFAGGGTIPLEAQRLGLDAQASDLNPVAVLINKALIDIPQRFQGQPPVFPGLASSQIRDWKAADGLAADVIAYGAWMRTEAERRIGHLYPDVDGRTPIAWIWARTVRCPNPACGIDMPLVRSWWLGKKKGKESFIVPEVVPDSAHPSGRRVSFRVSHDRLASPVASTDGTVGRTGAVCVACSTAVPLNYIRAEGREKRISQQLMAVVTEGNRQRHYAEATADQVRSAEIERPAGVPAGVLPENPRDFKTPNYGISTWADLFTNRQLVALTTFSDLVIDARRRVLRDGGSSDYADAVATYLGFAVSKALARNNTMCGWEPGMDRLRGSFQRQAVPMTWDYAEANPLSTAGGGLAAVVQSEAEVLQALVPRRPGSVSQADASTRDYHAVISTDPPYYDNIGYSDLSDFFYVWLRRSLRDVHPDLLSTMLVPKAEELVANPYRHNGKDGARSFFETGFQSVFAKARETASEEYPITVWYAFKQSETDEGGKASTGWETLLEGMITNGWEITSTWPNRSEMETRMIGAGSNALASSIVLSLRPRSAEASAIDRRGYLDQLREELPRSLRELQQGAIAPVDLAQAAIGPGMAVFSRYSKVVEPNGQNVTVREALRLINTVLAEVLSDQEGDFDTDTRWCLKWFETHGFEKAAYGAAETLATAFGTSVKGLDQSGAVSAKGGQVKLLTTAELPENYRPERDDRISLWEVALHLVKALDEKGLDEAGRILHGASTRVEPEMVKELAYLVFSLAEKRSATQVAGMYNALVTSWPEVTAAARSQANRAQGGSAQGMLDLDNSDD